MKRSSEQVGGGTKSKKLLDIHRVNNFTVEDSFLPEMKPQGQR
jgi:hypothetical protein